MTVRRLLAAAVLLAVFPLANAGAATGRALSIGLSDPAQVAAWRTVFLHPFTEATGIAADADVWSGGLAALKQPAKADDGAAGHRWDLVLVDDQELAAGCKAGAFQKLDWSRVGGKAHYMPQAVSDCGVGATVSNLVLAWDRGKLAASPTWADFWDVTKFPGKRGLHKGVRGNLEIALLADGVAPADIYKTLATSDGVERAFRKLDQLRPYIVWWKTPADAAKVLQSGDVLMTSAPSAVIVQAGRHLKRDFGIEWTGGLYDLLSFAVPKDAPDARAAMEFLYFEGTPAIEARLVADHGFGGLARDANAGLPPAVAALSPTLPSHLKVGLQVDDAFWQANEAKLEQRFEAWLKQPAK